MSWNGFDLNVEAMSREQLEQNYFDVIARLEAATMDNEQSRLLELSAQSVLGTSPRASRLLVALMDGMPHGRDYIYRLISKSDETDPKVVDVRIYELRKKLPPEISIKTIWGFGYQMQKDESRLLRELLTSQYRKGS